MDRILLEDLADAPPHSWARAIEVHNALSDYLSAETRDRAQARLRADELGMTVQNFDRLVELRQKRAAGAPKRTKMTGRTRRLSAEQEDIVRRSIATRGSGAHSIDISDFVQQACREAGVPPPSLETIRHRFRTAHAFVRIPEQMADHCDLIIDACRLGFDVSASDETLAPSFLLALIATRSGRIVAHSLHTNEIGHEDVEALIGRGMDQSAATAFGGRRVCVMPVLMGHIAQLAEALPDFAFKAARPARLPGQRGRCSKAGEALMRVFGNKIGRIRLLARADAKPSRALASVTQSNAIEVVNYLVQQRNHEIDP